MKIYQLVDSLLQYGKKKRLYDKVDYEYTLNALLSVLHLNEFVEVKRHINMSLDDILDGMITYAIEEKIIENTNESKDLFDSKIMGVFTPKPSEINKKFNKLVKSSPIKATDYFYNLCKDVNYIRSSRISKDIHFDVESEYGTINISINMSKPEKDPNDIKKLLTLKPICYPKCMLCKENVNYQGRIGFPARQNLRTVKLSLNNQIFYIQYSPYSYYNEHLICFHEDHFNMRINQDTFSELLDFVDMFPHYFIGSNAGLPIVGGSILNHHHFQGGKATLPMENATEHFVKTINNTNLYRLNWPLSVVRLKSKDKKDLLDVAKKCLDKWQSYSNDKLSIICCDENGLHNTFTPIARKKSGMYELDLVLRNNVATEDRPLGLFHPRSKYWHIKKENIGLIEVMGLAILPSRLKYEMSLVKKYLLNEDLSVLERDAIDKHVLWADELRIENDVNNNNVDEIINKGIGLVFVNVLKDCGVFKEDNQEEFNEFILSI